MRIRVTIEVGDQATSRAFIFDKTDSEGCIEEINNFILDKVYSDDVTDNSQPGVEHGDQET